MQARDVMVSPVITVTKSATVRDVAKILLKKRISAVPVVDEAGKVIGIVTEGDLIHRAEAGTDRHDSWWIRFLTDEATTAADYTKSHARRVEDVMTTDVVTAAPEMPLHEIATLLEERGVKRVPIVDKEGNLVGIVSSSQPHSGGRERPARARHEPSRFNDSTEAAWRPEEAIVGASAQPECNGDQRNR